jgi:hypothetical protein
MPSIPVRATIMPDGKKLPDLPLACLIRSQHMDPYRGSCGRTCSWNLAS